MQGSCCHQWSFKEFKYSCAQPVDIYHATYQEWVFVGFFNVFWVDLILHSHMFTCSPWGLHQGCRCCYSGLPFLPWACLAGRAAGNQLAMALVLSLLCVLHLVNPSCPLLAHYLLSPSLPAAWFLFPSESKPCFSSLFSMSALASPLPLWSHCRFVLFIACLLNSWSHAELWNDFSFLTVTVCNLSCLWDGFML